MAKIQRIPFIGPSYEAETKNANNQRTINFYIVPTGPEAKSPAALESTSGTVLVNGTPWTPPCVSYDTNTFCLFNSDSNLVTSQRVYELGVVAGNAPPANVSTTIRQTFRYGPAIAQSKYEVVIVGDETNIRGIVKANTVNFSVSAPANIRSSSIAYLDGYFVINKISDLRDSSKGLFYVSPLETANAVWSTTAFATMYHTIDDVQRIVACGGLLYLFSKTGYEVWYSTGNVDFPFSPIKEATQDIGLAQKNLLTVNENTIFFVGKSQGGYKVYALQGTTLSEISNDFISAYLSAALTNSLYPDNTLADLFSYYDINLFNAYAYTENNHTFIVFNLTSSSTTYPTGQLVFDLSTKLWHERRHLVNGSYRFPYISGFSEQQRGTSLIVSNPNYIADSANGSYNFVGGPLVRYDSTRNTEYFYNTLSSAQNTAITRTRITQHISGEDVSVVHHRVRLDCDNTNANITLYSSDDDGSTWYSFGEKLADDRIEWFRLGESEDRIYKIETSSNADVRCTGAYAEVSGGYW